MSTLTSVRRGAFEGLTWLLILSAGLFTTAIAMLGVHWVENRYHEPVISSYFYHFIPLGAIIVGLVSASGYLIATLLLEVRMGKRRVWTIAILQVVAYFVAQYVEFRSHHYIYADTLQPVSFWEWFHDNAMSYVLTDSERGPTPLRHAGYLLRALEIAIFAGCAGLLAAATMNQPYCKVCGRFLKTKRLSTIPASEFIEENTAEADLEQAIVQRGLVAFDALATIAESGSAETFLEQIGACPPQRSPSASNLDVQLSYCPSCMQAELRGQVLVKKPINSYFESAPSRPVSPAFAQEIIAPQRAASASG